MALKLLLRDNTYIAMWVNAETRILQQVSWKIGASEWVESIVGPSLDLKNLDDRFSFLREIMSSLKRTAVVAESIVCRRWAGNIIVEEGILETKNPRTIKTSKLIYNYDSLEQMFLEGWRF